MYQNLYSSFSRAWTELTLPVRFALGLYLVLGLHCVGIAQETNGEPQWGLNNSHIFNINSGNVGVGLNNPVFKMDVNGVINSSGYLKNGQQIGLWIQEPGSGPEIPISYNLGRVGIGTSSPLAALHLKRGNGLKMVMEQLSVNQPVYLEWHSAERAPWSMGINAAGDFRLSGRAGLGGSELVINGNTGSVGLGIENPGSYRLAVDGKVWAKELVVEAEWADDVFEEGYQLLSLEAVEAHIKNHGHLPAVPSEATVEAEGVRIGEMQATLLRKIEELTLYLIELNRENKELKSQLNTVHQ